MIAFLAALESIAKRKSLTSPVATVLPDIIALLEVSA